MFLPKVLVAPVFNFVVLVSALTVPVFVLEILLTSNSNVFSISVSSLYFFFLLQNAILFSFYLNFFVFVLSCLSFKMNS
jgi:hypothetical protein